MMGRTVSTLFFQTLESMSVDLMFELFSVSQMDVFSLILHPFQLETLPPPSVLAEQKNQLNTARGHRSSHKMQNPQVNSPF